MNSGDRLRVATVISVFVVVYTTLSVSSYVQKSATVDEPQHLTAGYTVLKRFDYRLTIEHPPLLHEWAALPLLAMSDVKLDTENDRWATADEFKFAHDFLYRQNDADALLYRARLMIVVLGLLLGVLVFCWSRELFGFWPAVLALWLYLLEPNLLAHGQLVTTDFGLTLFFFGAVYFLWRTTRRLNVGNVTGLAVFVALAHAAKFSAVVLVPTVIVLLLVWWLLPGESPPMSRGRRAITTAALLVLLALTTWFAIWAVYGFRHSPTPAPIEQNRFGPNASVAEHLPRLTAVVQWVDAHRLLPNAYSYGFLLGREAGLERTAFLAGHFSDQGWWYYFPVAFLLKTPITVLLLAGAGLFFCARRSSRQPADDLFLLCPIGLFMAAAMTSRLNIGLRHILPIYPFVILLAAKAFVELRPRLRRPLLAGLALLPLIETGPVYPHYLTFFNAACGGPRHGYQWLIDSNLDWGQDLKPLKAWMTQQQIPHINLAYFGTADPAYYAIHSTRLPSVNFYDDPPALQPRLPGYVAVSATMLQTGVINGNRTDFFKPLLESEPEAVIGHSIHVYWVERPWW